MFPEKKSPTRSANLWQSYWLKNILAWSWKQIVEIVDEQHVIAHDFCICMVINDVTWRLFMVAYDYTQSYLVGNAEMESHK